MTAALLPYPPGANSSESWLSAAESVTAGKQIAFRAVSGASPEEPLRGKPPNASGVPGGFFMKNAG